MRPTRFFGSIGAVLSAALMMAGLAGASPASAAGGIVIGDSIGVGVSMASGLSRLARNSVAIRGGSILSQLREVPAGSTVFMSLGTNDAVGRIDGLDGDISRIIAAASSSGSTVVWIGPPCVLKAWDTNAEKLDQQLKAKLSGTAVSYVSMRDPSLCSPSARAKDGVHFTMAGYGQMWAKARVVAKFEGGKTQVAGLSDGKDSKRKFTKRRKGSRYARRRKAPDQAAQQPAQPGQQPVQQRPAQQQTEAQPVRRQKPVAPARPASADASPR